MPKEVPGSAVHDAGTRCRAHWAVICPHSRSPLRDQLSCTLQKTMERVTSSTARALYQSRHVMLSSDLVSCRRHWKRSGACPAVGPRTETRIWCSSPTTGTPRCCPYTCRCLTILVLSARASGALLRGTVVKQPSYRSSPPALGPSHHHVAASQRVQVSRTGRQPVPALSPRTGMLSACSLCPPQYDNSTRTLSS